MLQRCNKTKMKRLSQPIRSFRCTWLIEYWRETVTLVNPSEFFHPFHSGSWYGTSIKYFFPFFFFPLHNIANFSVLRYLRNILFGKDSGILNYSRLGHTRARIVLTWSIFVWIYHIPSLLQIQCDQIPLARISSTCLGLLVWRHKQACFKVI